MENWSNCQRSQSFRPQLVNLYPVDKVIGFPMILIRWIVIYPVDSAIHRLNNWALTGKALLQRHQYQRPCGCAIYRIARELNLSFVSLP